MKEKWTKGDKFFLVVGTILILVLAWGIWLQATGCLKYAGCDVF